MVCKWKYDGEGFYETSCENSFFFDTGDRKENKFKYCPFCGNKIIELSKLQISGDLKPEVFYKVGDKFKDENNEIWAIVRVTHTSHKMVCISGDEFLYGSVIFEHYNKITEDELKRLTGNCYQDFTKIEE